MPRLIFAATFALALLVAGGADAKLCRNAQGRWFDCPVVHRPGRGTLLCLRGKPCGKVCIPKQAFCRQPLRRW